MQLPVIQGVIDRRLLINYRVDPVCLQRVVPVPFRPQLVNGYGIAGVCLIRFRGLRPRGWPATLGFSSENAAHRIAVEWDERGKTRSGVYVLRRQTNSHWNTWAGGWLFPGCTDRRRFAVDETRSRLCVAVIDPDGDTDFDVAVRVADEWPAGSVFADAAAASRFFEAGVIGYSPSQNARRLEGLELCCRDWRVEPLAIERVNSRFFENAVSFPSGSTELDCGLLMRGIEHEWRSVPDISSPAV